MKLCSKEGCTHRARKGGVCVRYGAIEVYTDVAKEGCTKYALGRGVSRRHGAKAKLALI